MTSARMSTMVSTTPSIGRAMACPYRKSFWTTISMMTVMGVLMGGPVTREKPGPVSSDWWGQKQKRGAVVNAAQGFRCATQRAPGPTLPVKMKFSPAELSMAAVGSRDFATARTRTAAVSTTRNTHRSAPAVAPACAPRVGPPAARPLWPCA